MNYVSLNGHEPKTASKWIVNYLAELTITDVKQLSNCKYQIFLYLRTIPKYLHVNLAFHWFQTRELLRKELLNKSAALG